MKKATKWLIGALVALAIILIVALPLIYWFSQPRVIQMGWRQVPMPFDFDWRFDHGMMRGYGYIFPFGIILGGLFRLGLLILVVVGIIALIRGLSRSGAPLPPPTTPPAPAVPSRLCPNCNRAVQDDWKLCPYCGHHLS